MEILSCKQAAFAYEGNTVVSGLNFTVQEGDYLCIVGENGAGKSTLVKGLLRLKEPSKGAIHFAKELRPGEIGYLPQQTSAQKDFPASAFEVVLSGCLPKKGFRPFYNHKDKEEALENLRLLGVDDLRSKCYRTLSGGQQQRVLLARALCATSRILLLDEPVAGLDPVATQELYHLIERLNREEKLTVVMVSHDIHSAVQYASHILHLSGGQAYFGTAEEYKNTTLGKHFLGGEEDERNS